MTKTWTLPAKTLQSSHRDRGMGRKETVQPPPGRVKGIWPELIDLETSLEGGQLNPGYEFRHQKKR